VDCGVGGCAQIVEQQQDSFLLYQPAHLLDSLWGAVAIVQADQIDLATVDSTLVVDHLEVGSFCLPDRAVRGCRPAVWLRLTDLDLSVGDARAVFLLGGHRTRSYQERYDQHDEKAYGCHHRPLLYMR